MANGNGTRAWGVALFLAGALFAGTAGVIRGDWLGRDAASEVRIEVLDIHDRDTVYLKEGQDRIEKKLDELLRIQR